MMKEGEIVLLKNFLSKDITSFLRQHVLKCHQRFLMGCKQGYYRKDTSSAFSMYGNVIFEDLLDISTKKVSSILDLQLIPTYSFVSVYVNGNELKKHVDREACEITMSLCLGYKPDDTKWPIHIENKSIDLEPGDAVIYGRTMAHWRDPFSGLYQAQAFFHWNDKRGPYGDKYKYDGRKYLGEYI